MIWLHIGTKKSGTTALQHYVNSNSAALQDQGLCYVSPPGKSSANLLAVAINKNRSDEKVRLGTILSTQLEARNTEHALISSEMFYGMNPSDIFQAIPALKGQAISVLIYLRRQDRYLESSYLQKLKNGRFTGTIADYIMRFNGSGADYWAMLKPWFDVDTVTVVPRICERPRLCGGDVIADALVQMGVDMPADLPPANNISPSVARVQLLSALAQYETKHMRRVQRVLMRDFPEERGQKAAFLSPKEREALLDQYQASNDALRHRFFPEQTSLFDNVGRGDDAPKLDSNGFSEAQMHQINALFHTLYALRGKQE